MFSSAMILALVIDALAGWPRWLFAAVGHPVTWLGRLIGACDSRFNIADASAAFKRAAGLATLVLVVAAVAVPAALVQSALVNWAFAWLALGILAWPLVAARSLYDHVADVLAPLERGDLGGGRAAVAMIVGRDVTRLDEAGVARAAIESLAENASDGIVAPLFWGTLFGLPGIAAYKAVNTLDSMIGHQNERYGDFGWASARFDDVLNFAPARLTGLMIAIASARPWRGLRVMMRDGAKHRSPNAGFPEAAMAGVLGVRLSGPRIYHDRIADEPWLNAEGPDPSARDIGHALGIYVRTMVVLGTSLAVLATLAAVSSL